MRIERLTVRGFGLFNRGITVDFGTTPVAVIVGDNETGKSTMMEAIVATMFGFGDAKDEKARRPWGAHDSYSCAITLRTKDQALIEITRDFGDNDVRVKRLDGDRETTLFAGKASPRGRSADTERYSAFLETTFGFSDAEVFAASIFVRQQQIETSLSERMRQIVSGSLSVDYEQARTSLEEKFYELTRFNPWGTRHKEKDRAIELAEKARDEIRLMLDEQRDAEKRLDSVVQKQHEVKEEIARLKSEIDVDAATLESLGRFNRLTEDIERVRKQETSLRRDLENARRLREKADGIHKELKERYQHFDTVDISFQKKLVQVGELQDEQERRTQALSVEEGRLEVARKEERAIAAVSLSVLGAIAGGVIGFLAGGATGCLIGVLAGSGLGYVVSRAIPSFPGGRAAAAETRASMLRADIEDIQERRETLIHEIESLCGTRDVAAVATQFEEYRTLQNQLGGAEEASKTFRPEQEIEREHDETVQKLAVLQMQVDQLLDAVTSLRNLRDNVQEAVSLETRLKTSCDEKRKKLEQLQTRYGQSEVEIARLTAAELEDPPVLRERLEQKERELTQLKLKRDAFKCAIDVLSEAIAEYRQSYVPRLEEEISSLFSRIVGSRYSRIRFDESLQPQADSAERSGIVPDMLSAGTRDQLYLAMRLAFARQISPGEPLPLILDDPFSNFDDQRIAAALQILNAVGDDQQIILFTHDRGLATWGTLVLDLSTLPQPPSPDS